MSRSSAAQDKWRRIIGDYRTSGLSIAAYCRERSISPPSFFAWKRRLGLGRKQGQSALPREARFVQVKTMEEPTDAAGQIELFLGHGHGRRLLLRRGFDRQLLLEVVAAL